MIDFSGAPSCFDRREEDELVGVIFALPTMRVDFVTLSLWNPKAR